MQLNRAVCISGLILASSCVAWGAAAQTGSTNAAGKSAEAFIKMADDFLGPQLATHKMAVHCASTFNALLSSDQKSNLAALRGAAESTAMQMATMIEDAAPPERKQEVSAMLIGYVSGTAVISIEHMPFEACVALVAAYKRMRPTDQ